MQTLTRTGRGELLDRTEQKMSSRSQRQFHSVQPIASAEVLLQVASFVHHEIPIRLARRIKDLDNVPYMSEMTSVQAVKDIYISSFLSLIKEPNIEDEVREALFARKLELLYERHSSVLSTMAKGAYELREKTRNNQIEGFDPNSFEQMNECHEFLDRFYMSRIGIRVLVGQYLCLRSQIGRAHV